MASQATSKLGCHRSTGGRSAKFRNSLGLLKDNSRVVTCSRSCRLTSIQHSRVRPEWDARAASAALLVAHHVAPLGAIDVPMRIGKRRLVRVHGPVVSGAENVTNLVCERVGDGRARMMHDKERFLRVCTDTR